MQLLAPLIALLGLATTVEGACSGPNTRTTPPPGAIVVDATGAQRGSFRTVAQAGLSIMEFLFICRRVLH
ncbi:hypothetical protein ON010_g17666 [Phytophthora cinnamomi]|nr:hypothetical protein ON010_g17666 [Phytophthora cinnamomi]